MAKMKRIARIAGGGAFAALLALGHAGCPDKKVPSTSAGTADRPPDVTVTVIAQDTGSGLSGAILTITRRTGTGGTCDAAAAYNPTPDAQDTADAAGRCTIATIPDLPEGFAACFRLTVAATGYVSQTAYMMMTPRDFPLALSFTLVPDAPPPPPPVL